jgi:hypothetical protein
VAVDNSLSIKVDRERDVHFLRARRDETTSIWVRPAALVPGLARRAAQPASLAR